jgi:hypothetical protein
MPQSWPSARRTVWCPSEMQMRIPSATSPPRTAAPLPSNAHSTQHPDQRAKRQLPLARRQCKQLDSPRNARKTTGDLDPNSPNPWRVATQQCGSEAEAEDYSIHQNDPRYPRRTALLRWREDVVLRIILSLRYDNRTRESWVALHDRQHALGEVTHVELCPLRWHATVGEVAHNVVCSR